MWPPVSSKRRVMPSFRTIKPVRMAAALELDLDAHAGRQGELHQRVHGLRSGVDDVEHALVRADFKLLARLLVDVRRAVDGEALDLGRQRDRTTNGRAGALGRVDDLAGGMIQHAVIEGPEPDADILTIHIARNSSGSRKGRRVFQTISKTDPVGPKVTRNTTSAKNEW